MKHLFFSLILGLILISTQAQESFFELYPGFYGLSKDVNIAEEKTYEYDDLDFTTKNTKINILTFKNGKLISNKTDYLGEYPSQNETTYTYDANGLLIKKVYNDITYNSKSTYTYQYEKGKLKVEIYENEYGNSKTYYDYDAKGRLIKATVKNDTDVVTNISEYSDYGTNSESFTVKNTFLSENAESSIGISVYKNAQIISYKNDNDYFGETSYTYIYDANKNLIETKNFEETYSFSKYEYIGENYIQKYFQEDSDLFKIEEFNFRKITFTNGKTIGSTEPDMAFIEKNNVVIENEDYDLNKLETGCISGNCIEGYGTFNYDNGEQYEGFFKNAQRNGPGLLMYEDGSNFNGMWKDDEKNGLGFYSAVDGTFFLGYHQSNMRNGYGIEQLIGEDGVVFSIANWELGTEKSKFGNEINNVSVGCISGDCQNGFGSYLYENGDIYMGFFKNGMYDKVGMYVYKEGDVFIGSHTEQKRSGYGMYVWQNGSVYYGEYANDTYQGLGAYIPTDDGQKLIGEFQNGNLSKSMAP